MTATLQTAVEIKPREMEPWQSRHTAPIPPRSVRHWVMQCVALCRPDRVYWCTGTGDERRALSAQIKSRVQTDNSTWCEIGQPLLGALFRGCMKGRTMYVVPFAIARPGRCRSAKVGVQITDSIELVMSLAKATRIGDEVWQQLREGDGFTSALHSLGDGNPEHRYVCHLPQDSTIWSFGLGYDGRAAAGTTRY